MVWVCKFIDMTQSNGVVGMQIFRVESSVVGLTSWYRFCIAFKKMSSWPAVPRFYLCADHNNIVQVSHGCFFLCPSLFTVVNDLDLCCLMS